ncbi:hypothetical protein [Streptomyces sp. NPDC002845]
MRRLEYPRFADFRRAAGQGDAPVTPPPPVASARFPDAPPAAPDGRDGTPPKPAGTPTAAAPRTTAPEENRSETTTRRGPAPAESPVAADRPVGTDNSTGWAPPTSSSRRSAEALDGVLGMPGGRPFVTLGQPEISPDRFDDRDRRPRIGGTRAVTAVACVVLGLGLIGGAAAGTWLTGDGGADDGRDGFTAAGELWHSVPVDELFPPTVRGEGAGPGGADRVWTRIAVAPDSGCADAFDPLLRKVLSPVGCLRLLRATYTDATQSHVTTVGMLFTKADPAAMSSLEARFEREGLDRRTDLMPRPYAVPDTLAADFGVEQRASWSISVLTDAPVVVYAVSGFADGRTIAEPQPTQDAMKADDTTAVAQSGLGHEAQGLADRVERGFRKTVSAATENPS